MANEVTQSVMESKIQKTQLHNNLLKFPPFYTIQEHKETRKRQLLYWSEITHKYFKDHNILHSSVSELNSEQFTLFSDNSTGILKRLSKQEILMIIEELVAKGSIQWKNLDNKENFTVNFFSSFELADCIFEWGKKNHLKGDIETVNFISNGEQTGKDEKFYNLPQEQIIQALYVLEENGKGEVLEYNGETNFKFG
ncbi:hypothetical protein PPERSA_05957 [Pseudocohnilembus persalinus]|uniref:ESCRT-II complex, vps25 subunit n=1 Tax=Pseudocohnilembus persalinus TaxID=266149 RepID=A0A0V0R4Z5_PSEPJ|nr:hypothetical protein PPERSA_05957 [Pseudocohnilembus persalinus]|eukprot:KRX09288.1 hypothetical protein PPERSA_05957 [Pseudocohnilembus persalinus]